MKKIKIAFLMLDGLHHLHHLAPIAFEVSQLELFDCYLFTQKTNLKLLKKIEVIYPNHQCRIQALSPSFQEKIKLWLKKNIPWSGYIIKRHKNLLKNFDAIFSADIDLSFLMQDMFSKPNAPFFGVCHHGAGDRSPYFSSLINYYDLVLLAGEKYRRVFFESEYWSEKKFKIIGYPKFDIIPKNDLPSLFSNKKPIVLYNPHHVLEISSWTKWGLQVLEFFFNNPFYNLIFAPHCILFNRKVKLNLSNKYKKATNIIIDLGSEHSVDMTYTRMADVYLGDVSSQVYEFIRNPKPCIFLNANAIQWKLDRNYNFWNLGKVVDEINQLELIFNENPITNLHEELQKRYFNDTFSIMNEPAAKRAARVIQNCVIKNYTSNNLLSK